MSELIIYTAKEGELAENAAVKESLTVQVEGKRFYQKVHDLLEFNEQPVLQGPGSVSHDDMKTLAHQHYENFATVRRQQETHDADADAEDLRAIEGLEKELKQKGGKS